MPKVTFVIGLCGSGKTWHADRISAETGAKQFEGVVGKNQFSEVVQWLQAGDDCVVEEISFCDVNHRNLYLKSLPRFVPSIEIDWVCLENDLESANWNVRRRTKGDVDTHLGINGRVSQWYSYPEGCVPIPITRIVPSSS